MKKIIHRANTRGHAEHGWLTSYHTFSFAEYRNAERVHFGLLRVINDDVIAPSMGFGTHPHDNMEIVSVPLAGRLRHQDSMGNVQRISAGEIQVMSAGSGLTHSEYNDSSSEPAALLQIWIFPNQREIKPSYGQKKFDREGRRNKVQWIVAADQREGAIGIHQEAYLSLIDLEAGRSLNYSWVNPKHGLYVFVIEGTAEIAGEELGPRDGMGLVEGNSVSFKASTNSQLLTLEVPMDRNDQG